MEQGSQTLNSCRMRAVSTLSKTSAPPPCWLLPPQGLGTLEGERAVARPQLNEPLATEASAGQDICPERLAQSSPPLFWHWGVRRKGLHQKQLYHLTSDQPQLLLELISSTVTGIIPTSLGQVAGGFFNYRSTVMEPTIEKQAEEESKHLLPAVTVWCLPSQTSFCACGYVCL